MEHFPPHRGEHESFVCREIKLDFGPSARGWRHRSAIAGPPLAGDAPARVLIDVETDLVRRHSETGFIGNPCDNLTEHSPQEAFVKMAFVAQGEVKILRKSVRLEVALLEARSTFEYPGIGELRMGMNSGEHPAQYVVLLHHVGQQLQFGSRFKNFALVDHVSLRFQRSGTHSRQAVTRCVQSSAGSSRA